MKLTNTTYTPNTTALDSAVFSHAESISPTEWDKCPQKEQKPTREPKNEQTYISIEKTSLSDEEITTFQQHITLHTCL